MDKKTIITTILIVVGILGLFMILGKNNQEPTKINSGEESTLLVEGESIYDFGNISMKDGLTEHIFKVTNSGDKDVFLKKIETSCMCTIAYLESSNGKKGPFGMAGHGGGSSSANENIKTGDSLDIRVVYDPNAHGPAGVGIIDRFVNLTDANGNELQLEIKAVVTP